MSNSEQGHALEKVYADAVATWLTEFEPEFEPVDPDDEDALFHELFANALDAYPDVEAVALSHAIRDGFADARHSA